MVVEFIPEKHIIEIHQQEIIMFKPQILQSQLIKLVPMTMGHLEAYRTAGNFPEVWQHMPMNRCEN